MPAEWKDTTSYRQGEERNPRCWSAKFGDLEVTVLTGHIYYPGEWVMHFRPFCDAHPLGAKKDELTPAKAQERALQIARAKLAPIFKALDSAVTVL